MKVHILRKVPVMMNGNVAQLAPGMEVDGLGDSVTAALIRGGDAEEIVEASVAPLIPPLAERLFSKAPSKKNRGAAPENK